MKRKNKVYSIVLSDANYSLPSVCSCCMKTADTVENVEYSGTRTISAPMPICSECIEHRDHGERDKIIGISLAVVVGLLLFAVLAIMNVDYAWFIPSVVVAVSCLVFPFLISARKLPKGHSAREESVFIYSDAANVMYPTEEQKNSITFFFTNLQFAKLFKAMNADIAGEITEIKMPNTSKRKMNKAVFKRIIIVTVIFAVIASFANNKIEKAKDAKRPYIEYTANAKVKDKVYAEIVYVSPEYKVEKRRNGFNLGTEGIVCRCMTRDNQTVWIYVYVDDYIYNDPGFDDIIPKGTDVFFGDKPITIYGKMRRARDILGKVLDQVQEDKIIEVAKIQANIDDFKNAINNQN